MTRAIARDPIYRRRRFQSETIELCVRWYLTYRLSYRDLVEMMAERGVTLSHSTILCVGCIGTCPSSNGVWVAMRGLCIHRGGWTRPRLIRQSGDLRVFDVHAFFSQLHSDNDCDVAKHQTDHDIGRCHDGAHGRGAHQHDRAIGKARKRR
jgi:hypothetical protein